MKFEDHSYGAGLEKIQATRLRYLWVAMTVWLAAFGGHLIAGSMHWPLVHDAPILIYMGFLSEHGMRLYRDINEVQFPGSVLLYRIGREVFGTSDLGFRLFDLSGLLVALATMLYIARRLGYWFAGVFGFALFLWLHAGDSLSIYELGQRDFFMAVLLGLAVAFLLGSMRSGRANLMAGFGLMVGLSASIKPNSLLFLLLLVLVVVELRSRDVSISRYLGWAGAGLAAGVVVIVGYLVWQHALLAFIRDELVWLPLYEELPRELSVGTVFGLLFFGKLQPLLLLSSGILVALQPSLRKNREQQVLLVAAVLAALEYMSQGKGFPYQRLPFHYFCSLWIGWVLVGTVVEGRKALRWCALTAAVLATLAYPHLLRPAVYDMTLITNLQVDLTALHVADQPRELECLDATYGCITVALRMQAVTATGYLGGFLLFLNKHDPKIEAMRQDFMNRLQANQPRVIVLTNERWPQRTLKSGYDRLAYWPQFAQYLQNNYVLTIQRDMPWDHLAWRVHGYRIYVRKPPS